MTNAICVQFMARMARCCAQWVPGTVMQRTGLVSYVDKVADSKLWIRHIRPYTWNARPSTTHTARDDLGVTRSKTPSVSRLPCGKPPISTDISVTPDLPYSPKQSTQSESQPEPQSPAPTSKTSIPQHRYPTRIHKPPERLTYYSK